MKSLILRLKRQVAAIVTIIHHLPPVTRENGKGQRVVILIAAMVAQYLFGFRQSGVVQRGEIQRQQTLGQQHLLGIEELIKGFTCLMPGTQAGAGPADPEQQHKTDTQPQKQAH